MILPSIVWLVGLSAPVVAQTVPVPVNPSRIEWNCPDHAIDNDHEVGFFLAGAANPVQATRLGDPAPLAPCVPGTCRVGADISARPLNIGQYEMKLRIYAGSATTPEITPWRAGGLDGATAVPFARALFPPDSLTVVR